MSHTESDIYDQQQKAVYRAQREARASSVVVDLGDDTTRRTPEELVELRDQIVRSRLWRERAQDDLVPELLFPVRGDFASYGWSANTIDLPPRYRTNTTLVHEMAHALAGRFDFETHVNLQSHGSRFAETYLQLSDQFTPAVSIFLRGAFYRHNVFVGPEKRPSGDEYWNRAHGFAARRVGPDGRVHCTVRYIAEETLRQSINGFSVLDHIRESVRDELDRACRPPRRPLQTAGAPR